jgi:CrcB protein
MSGLTWLAFLAAAAVGAPARYLLDGLVQRRTAGTWPWGTFTVNVVGAFVLGVLTGAGLYHGLGTPARLALGTGFCGAFTKFSTFTFETDRLAEHGDRREALVNVAGSLAAGLTAAAAGLALAWAL